MAQRKVTFILAANLSQWGKNLDKAQRRMERFGHNMVGLGRSMGVYLTAPALAAGGAAVKMATDFDTSFNKIVGLVGVARDEVEGMRKEVLRLAGETARAPQELADALFFITSAGLRGRDALDVLEMSARAATAGLGDTATVADLVTSAVNAYGQENLSAAMATDILTAAVREGKAEAPELAQSLGQVLPIASEMGVTFDQVGAAVASMTRTGTDAATAAIHLRQILSMLLKPANEAETALTNMGTSSAQLRRQLHDEGLISVLSFLRQQMNTNEQAMAQVFGNVRALSGALDIMGSNAETNIGIFKRMTDATGTLDEAFGAVEGGPAFKFNQALAQLKVNAIEFGGIMLPLAVKIVGAFTVMAGRFQSLTDEQRTQLLKIVAAAVLLPPALIAVGVAAKGAAVAMGVLKGIIGLSKAALVAYNFVATLTVAKIKAIAAAVWLLTKRIALMLAGFTAIIGIFAAVVTGGQYVVDNWDKFALMFSSGAKAMEIAVLKMAKKTLTALTYLVAFLVRNSGVLGQVMGITIAREFSDTGIYETIERLDSQIKEGEQELAESIGDYNNIEWGSFGDSAKNAIMKAKGIIKAALSSVLNDAQIQELIKAIDILGGNDSGTAPAGGGVVDPTTATGEGVSGSGEAFEESEQDLKEWTNANEQAFNYVNGLAKTFANSFGQGLANVIVQGEKLQDVLENIGKLLLSSAIQTGISALLTGGLGGTGFFGSGGGLIGKIFNKSSGTGLTSAPAASFPNMNIERAFERALKKNLSTVGPNEIATMANIGNFEN
jgi:TP901 family phage tail tape measure protein